MGDGRRGHSPLTTHYSLLTTHHSLGSRRVDGDDLVEPIAAAVLHVEAVLDFYDAGGGHGIGADLPHQTLSPDSPHLDRSEKRAIIAFLRTLTDTAKSTARPDPSAREPSSRPAAR